ncbi:uncharacterized protein LOC105662860 isoform X2 [Megachile rotundata]|nr:PREDICTED: uncharacterized protein LOC105662860 isoform X2 [Megachile rotundata]
MTTLNETYDSYIKSENNLKNVVRYLGKLQKYQESKVNTTYIENDSIPSFSTIYCYADTCNMKSTFAFNNLSLRVEEKKWNLFGYKWKRRSLCAVHDDKKHSPSTPSNVLHVAKRKTLMDYDAPVLLDDIEDSNSLKTHVRVKRSKSDWSPLSSSAYQQEYLRDLANSFPRNTYESVDENSYDDDTSFDAKREIKSEQFSVPTDKDGPTKVIDTLASDEKDNSIVLPSDVNKVKVSVDNGETGNREIAEESDSFTNRRNDENMEIDLPDPMMAVDLVRKKRNNVMERSESQNSNENENRRLSSLVAANLKAHLLRVRRRAKNNHDSSKTKKKKKHAGKKQGKNSRRSLGNERTKNANKLRTPRERKPNAAKSEGKSNVGITKVVSKENNENNFHRRFVESKDSVDNSKNDRSSKHLVLENNADNSEPSSAIMVTGNDDDMTKSEDNGDTSLTQNKKEQTFLEMAKLREKRNKNTEGGHGFLNKEDELKYYENIREPETERRCNARNKIQRSVMVEGEGRAVRSIEEVKELAKKLVTKVNELQNFINAGDPKANDRKEKTVETRAIDDLCSNASTDYDVFNEPPQIVQKCVPMGDKYSSNPAKIIVERKIGSSKIAKENKNSGEKGRSTIEKKRSIVRRIPKTPSSTSKTVRRENAKPRRKWGRWTDWSSCSVTCGKGRQIRWRYCLRDCNSAETEMEEKACQLPACPPGKFLGIF